MRLIDLHCNWALQYVGESSQYDPTLYPEVPGRLAQLEGYLSDTAAAVLFCGRTARDWERQDDPWRTLAEMITRYEAEFPGRLLASPADAARWGREPEDSMCWGVLGVEGFDFLIRTPADLNRLAALFDRGVRVFQMVATSALALGGVADLDLDHGLSSLGRAFLDCLAELAPEPGSPGPRPILDLTKMGARTMGDVLSWFESDPARPGRVLLICSRADVLLPSRPGRPNLTQTELVRFRALGGLLGLGAGAPEVESAAAAGEVIELLTAIPWKGKAGCEGIGIGTGFLEVEAPAAPLASACRLTEWLAATFPSEIATAIAGGNARKLLLEAAGKTAGTDQQGFPTPS
ncbi:MAG: membrane dipeptidase [Planctomycetaceae bacterium]|nr:membrane dipeptidase [Planctomycetaceae bacterium]